MNTVIIVLTFSTVAFGAPRLKLHFRNLYRNPIETNRNLRITGGQEAEPHSIPFQALLEIYSDSEGWYCEGSLISQNYILTAAHCAVDGVKAYVTLGAHKVFEKEDTQFKTNSTEITVHEDYDNINLTNDIAVIKLPESVELTEAIQVAALPTRADADNDYIGSVGRLSGWGATDGLFNDMSEVLNYADVEVITMLECEAVFPYLPESIMCTSGAQNKGSCSGDSGAPLVIDGVQVGVASFAVPLCEGGFPSGFSRLTSFLDWIETNTDVQIQ